MAQKREKEETDLKVPESLLRTAPIPSMPKLSTADDSNSRSPESTELPANQPIHKVPEPDESRSSSASSPERPDLPVPDSAQPPSSSPSPAEVDVKRREVNRCSGCRRKVGLTGFRCRCGEMFCWEHRYSDRHDCSFDYKASGREAIARENPVVRAAKILKV